MKNLAIAACAAAQVFAGSVQAQSLVGFDFNNLCGNDDPTTPTLCAPCIDASDLHVCNLVQSLHFDGGPDGSNFRSFSGWDVNPNYDFERDGVWQWPYMLAFDVSFADGAGGAIGNLSLDWQRPALASPGSIQAAIYWMDGAGAVQHRISDAVALSGTGTWESLAFDWTFGSADLPSGDGLSGAEFQVELYAWGGDGELYLDNLRLGGECSPIPEPGGAFLIGAAGLWVILRRQSRRGRDG